MAGAFAHLYDEMTDAARGITNPRAGYSSDGDCLVMHVAPAYGSLEDSDSLAAGYYVEYTFDMYPGPDCQTYNVYASSTGGGLGGESDSENVYLCAGETKTADLYI